MFKQKKKKKENQPEAKSWHGKILLERVMSANALWDEKNVF